MPQARNMCYTLSCRSGVPLKTLSATGSRYVGGKTSWMIISVARSRTRGGWRTKWQVLKWQVLLLFYFLTCCKLKLAASCLQTEPYKYHFSSATSSFLPHALRPFSPPPPPASHKGQPQGMVESLHLHPAHKEGAQLCPRVRERSVSQHSSPRPLTHLPSPRFSGRAPCLRQAPRGKPQVRIRPDINCKPQWRTLCLGLCPRRRCQMVRLALHPLLAQVPGSFIRLAGYISKRMVWLRFSMSTPPSHSSLRSNGGTRYFPRQWLKQAHARTPTTVRNTAQGLSQLIPLPSTDLEFYTPTQYGKNLNWKQETYTSHDVASVFRRYLTQMPVRPANTLFPILLTLRFDRNL